MPATMTHRNGGMDDYAAHLLPALVAELDAYEDDEHPDIAVSHESGWTLSAFPSGLLVWENVDADDEDERSAAAPRHLRDVPRERLSELLALCGDGRLDELERLPWRVGYS
ncbi:hypothetical protein [Dactylosporangium sp. NPDC049140]|uniref:hypothetical protein n=1 Tax=Dactylosporangium sp. NPDC049140 TaxID=3155647 RepID=UPI0033E9DC0D